jgi:hypothetical protein
MCSSNLIKAIKVLCFAGIQLISSSAFAGLDRTEVAIELTDSNTSDKAIILVKDDAQRMFFLCDKLDQVIDRGSCSFLDQHELSNIKNVEDRYEIDAETPFYHKLGRIILAPIGTAGGLVVGGIGAIVLGTGGSIAAPGPGTVAGTIAAWSFFGGAVAGGGYVGYKIGSFIDGSPFSDDETNAMLNTFGHADVINDAIPTSGVIKVDLDTDEFLDQLDLAGSLLE